MIKKFANNSDVKLLVEEKQINTLQFKRFLAKRGVFPLARNSTVLSNQIYPIFFGSHEINRIQELLHGSNSYQKSSMLTLSPIDKDMSINDFILSIHDELQNYTRNEGSYKIEASTKDSDGNLNIVMSYEKKLKGRNVLLQTKKKVLRLKIKKSSDKENLFVDIRQNDNSDLKEVELFFNEINQQDSSESLFKVSKLTLDSLTKEHQIKFFDDLIARLYDDWKLDDIKGVDFKRYKNSDDPDAEISSSELAGINSAIFKGSSIRDTGIVKKFESEGFYFTSMKFKYAYTKTLESFVIDIHFKGTTEGIKVDIVKTYEKDENEKDIVHVLPPSQQEEIILCFQKASYEVFNNLISAQLKAIKEFAPKL